MSFRLCWTKARKPPGGRAGAALMFIRLFRADVEARLVALEQ